MTDANKDQWPYCTGQYRAKIPESVVSVIRLI